MMGDWFFGVGILIEGDGNGFELEWMARTIEDEIEFN